MPNYCFVSQTNPTDDNNTTGTSTTGSDVNALGVSYGINLSAGENNPNIDAGLKFASPTLGNCLGDRVWLDNGTGGGTAADGIQNGTEPGVAGIRVSLIDNASGNTVAITTTDVNGIYQFCNISPNTMFKVSFSAPGGTVFTSSTGTTPLNTTVDSDADQVTGMTAPVNSGAPGTQITGVDAGI